MAAGAAIGALYWSHIGASFIEAVTLTGLMTSTLLVCPKEQKKIVLMVVGFGLPGITELSLHICV